MTEARLIHDAIVERLNADNVIDLSTLPTLRDRETLRSKVSSLIDNDYVTADPEVRSRVQSELFGAGPIENLLADRDVTEIIVNGPKSIWYEKAGVLQVYDDRFFSNVSYQNFLQRLAAECGVEANLDRPFADGYWRQCRVHLIIPPLTPTGPHLSLRRHPENPWTFSRFAESDWAPPAALDSLRRLVREHASLLIVGATGSGKTSVLNACLAELPPHERVVTIEDTSEIRLPNAVSTKLLARQNAQGVLPDVTQAQLLRQALRMRPDRIVMGEVRGDEAKDLLMALSTGHRGGLATVHAESPHQALYRLEMLIQMGAPQWSLSAIRHLIYFGLQAVVGVKREGGRRRLASIHRLSSLEETGFCLEPIYLA